jgi:hypothetical protein
MYGITIIPSSRNWGYHSCHETPWPYQQDPAVGIHPCIIIPKNSCPPLILSVRQPGRKCLKQRVFILSCGRRPVTTFIFFTMKSIPRRIALKVGRGINHDLLTSLERMEHNDYKYPGRQDDAKAPQIYLALYYKDLMTRNATLPSFDEVGFHCYSQFEEDGILLFIFSLIGAKTKMVVELCAGKGRECMATNLIINHGWNGFLFDSES